MKLSPKSLIVAVIFVALIVGYYYYLSNRTDTSAEAQSELTEVQLVTTENLEQNYPATPREVIKFYNRVVMCFYNEEYDEEEFEAMIDQARELFDADLLSNNPRDMYEAKLRADVLLYHRDGKTISNVTISDSKDVRREEIGDRDYAYVDCTYYIREGSSFAAVNQTYMMRKDAEGRWKILAFYQG